MGVRSAATRVAITTNPVSQTIAAKMYFILNCCTLTRYRKPSILTHTKRVIKKDAPENPIARSVILAVAFKRYSVSVEKYVVSPNDSGITSTKNHNTGERIHNNPAAKPSTNNVPICFDTIPACCGCDRKSISLRYCFSSSVTTAATSLPSALPRSSGVSLPMTLPISWGLLAPTSAMTFFASAIISSRESCRGM